MDKAVRRRDLASPDLWDRSLRRSRERRRVAEIHRRTAPRRKGVSLAVSAALLASPVVPRFASAHAGSGAGATTEDTGGGPAAAQAPRLLERGDTGAAVEKVQRAIGVTADGIFGPITEAAVKRFQGHEGLSRTGKVDPSTWMKLFSGNVTVLEAGTSEAQAIQTAAGDEPTPPIAASSSPAKDDSGDPVASPAAFQPTEEERRSPETGAEPREPREPARTRRASSDDRDRAPSKPRESSGRESSGEDRERSTNRPASDEREEPRPRPAPDPAPSGGGGGGGSCEGDFARPVNGTVTGVFGEDRGGRSHGGMDIAAPSGTPIKAATCGRVSEAGFQGGYGNIICIRASESFTTCYAHMSRFGASVGQYVKIGEVIGYVGCTGSCTGPHVHFEVRIDGQQVDPAPYLNGSRRGPGARSSSTMAVSLTDSTRKTPEARTAKREKVERQHDEAAKDPAQQPQISTAAAGDGMGATEPTGETSPTTASTDDTAASAPAAADPSTQTPGGEADPASGVVQDTTGAVEETAAAVEDTTGSVEETGAVEETTSSATEEAAGAVEEVTDAPGSDTSSVDETTGTVDETTGSVEEDASSAVGETTETDAPGSDTDTGAADETTDGIEEDTSSAADDTTSTVEETAGSVEEDASSAADDTTSTVDETAGSSDEATDTPGQDGPDSSSEDTSGDDTAVDDTSGDDASEDGASDSEEPAATAGG